MSLNETELLERDAKRNIWRRIACPFGMLKQAVTVQAMMGGSNKTNCPSIIGRWSVGHKQQARTITWLEQIKPSLVGKLGNT